MYQTDLEIEEQDLYQTWKDFDEHRAKALRDTLIAKYSLFQYGLNPTMQFELSMKYGEYGHCFQCAKQRYDDLLAKGL